MTMMADLKWEIYVWVIVGLMAIFAPPPCHGFTDLRDVIAISSLYVALGYPPLPGWLLIGGDPCGGGWQGVQCVNSNITGIVLNGANLGGELDESLGAFASIIQIDLSNNHIGGSIPSNLPITIKSFFLSGNQLTGSIPDTLSTLGQLSDLSLNSNHLTGVIPDSFQQLTSLANLDLSDNNLSGQLPPSMGNLSSIATLHLQDNHLSGTLDILQDLPLIDLDIENNLFSGPIPPKLLRIPNFRSTGNPFNTTIIPSPPALPPSPSSFGALPPEIFPGIQAIGPSPPEVPRSTSGQKFLTTKKLVWIAIGGFLILVVLAMGLCLCMSRQRKERPLAKFTNGRNMDAFISQKKNSQHTMSSLKSYDHGENVPRKDNESDGLASRSKNKQERDVKADHQIDMTGMVGNSFAPPSQPPPIVPVQSVIVKPVVPPTTTNAHTMKTINSARPFTIASLQQYTNSFSQENLIGGGIIGTVYRADLPNRKLLAVKKVDIAASRQWSDEDFTELVTSVSKLQHDNIVELVGYCAEHGQQLLVYKYCTNGTLHEALHLDDEIHEKLSWNARIHLALQAARALEYLHEVCQPPIVHWNFKSANVLLDDELVARVSDCGLAPLIPSNNITQLQGSGYGAPELELGVYTYQSDVYSFGVVMLELLTGRKAYDRSQPRGEQFLVRWAIPQLHDIDALSRMVDPSLNSAYSSKSLSRFADIISLCVQPEPEFRPPMSEIVQSLLHMIQRGP